MADGTLRGVFALDARDAVSTLESIRDRGAEADASLERLGSRMDSLSTRSAAMSRTVSTTWGSMRVSIEQEADRIGLKVDELQGKLDRFGSSRSSAKVELSGIDVANAQLTELEARLDRLNRQRASPRVSIGSSLANDFAGRGGGGGGVTSTAMMAGGGGNGRSMFSSLGGAAGVLPWWALLAPVAPGLLGGATALLGSAGSATLGVGTAGLGGLGALGVGGALTGVAAKQSITAIGAITAAQTAYTHAVVEFGRASSQAATAKKALNAAMVQNPGAVGAARQYEQFRARYSTAFAPARAQIDRGISGSLYNLTRGSGSIGGSATIASSATANAAISYSHFLMEPQQLATVRQLAQSFASDMPLIEKAVANLTQTFGHLAVDATPFFHEGLIWIDHWTAGLDKASTNTVRVQQKMQGYVNSAKDWGHLLDAAYHTLRDIFSAGTPSGNSMVVQLTSTLDKWDRWINANPGKVQGFFQQAETTTGRVASLITNVIHDLMQVFNYLSPIFSRGLQLLQLVSGTGAGGLGILGAIGLGGYQGLRNVTGGPSAGSLAGAFVTGSATGFRGGGARLGGGVAVGGAAADTALTRSSYLLASSAGYRPTYGAPIPAGAMGSELPLLAAIGGARFAGTTLASAPLGTPSEFAARYGSLEGARYAMPMSAAGELPFAARTGILSRGAGALGAFAEGAAKFALPVLGITSVMQALQTQGGVGSKIQGGLDSALHLASFGLLPKDSIQQLLGTTNIGASLSNPRTSASITALGNRAGAVRTPQQLHALNRAVQDVSIQYELPPDQRQKLESYLRTISATAAQNAGGYASNMWETAFQTGLTTQGPKKAVDTMLTGIKSQLKELGPQGAKAFASSTAVWVSQLEQEDPKLAKPMQKLMDGVVSDLNDTQKRAGNAMQQLAQTIFYYNGQIYTGSDQTWSAIRDSLVNKAQVAQEKLSGIWGTIQTEAIDALKSMGYSTTQARTLVTQTAQGGRQAANASFAIGVTTATGTPTSALSTTAPAGLTGAKKKKATGGMLGGSGLLDTVPLPDGSMAAPGEAWIANRHTMNDLSRATLAKYGKTAWQMIRDETRMHSAPNSSRNPGAMEGIMPGFQRGGSLGALTQVIANAGISMGGGGPVASMPRMVSEADWINAQHYPYLWGGGHNANFTGPYDCSGAVSAVLHAGGVLNSPEVAQEFMSYGLPGPGNVTLYASPSHVYMSLMGRYFGTSLSNPGGGAAWFNGGPRPGFVQRHLATSGSATGIPGFSPTGAAMQSIGSLSLRSRASGLGGVPGGMADAAGRIYAAGLQSKLNAAVGSGSGGTLGNLSGFTGGGSSAANQTLGQKMMLAAGWPISQWPSLQALWTQESGWSDTSVNSGSGAYGIPQALGHGHPFNLGDAPAQIAWGLNYIKGRYGSPSAAEGHERAFNWYQRGGKTHWGGWNARGANFLTNGPTLFGAGEGGRRERVSVTPANTPTSGGARIVVNFNGPVYASSEKDIDELGQKVAGKILDALDAVASGTSDKQLARMGGGNA